jgi:rhamnose transport system substrate-binding protein
MIRKTSPCLLALLPLLFAACGQSPQNREAESPSEVRIVYIAKNLGNPYFDSIEKGFRQAAEELGYDFHHVGPSTAEATSQLPLIRQQMQRGVHVIAISPNSTDALNQVFREAMNRGIVVLSVNSDITGSETFRHGAVLPMDFEMTGSSQVELMGSLIDYEGKIAILSSTTDAPDQNYWIQGMREALKDPKYAKMELVTVVYGNDDPQKSLVEAEALLTRYPDLRGIIAPTTVGIAAAAQAVESANRAPQVQVTGLGTPNQMRRFVKNGTVQAFALWDPFNVGYASGHLGTQLALKQLQAESGASFGTPRFGAYELGENAVVIAGPPLVFTRENIDEFHF